MGIMDDLKTNSTNNNNPTSNQNEYKQSIDDPSSFNDNDSLQNHVDSHDYPIDNDLHHHTIISNRDNAPPPPSGLTLASLQHFNNENPPQNMLSAVDNQSGDTSSHLKHDLNFGNIIHTVSDL